VKILIALIGIILFIGLMWFKYSRPVNVDAIKIIPSTIEITMKEQGTVTSFNEYPVNSFTKGRIEELPITEGQEVKKDQILLRISSKELEFELKNLNAKLQSILGQEQEINKSPLKSEIEKQQIAINESRRNLEKSINDYNNVSQDYLDLKVSKTELDNARKIMEDLRSALSKEETTLKLLRDSALPTEGNTKYYKGQRDSINAEIENIKYKLSKNEFIAPFDGIIQGLKIKQGDVVMQDMNLFTVVEKERYIVEVFVLPEDAVFLKDGDKVKLIQKRKDEDVEFSGEIKRISKTASEKISSLGISENRVKITIEPYKSLNGDLSIFPGFTMDVKFTLQSRENALGVPKNSVFSSNGKEYVWKIIDNKAKLSEVRKGFKTDDSILIEEGILPYDIIVYNPQEKELKDGANVSYKIED
jgi:HlyD family secretion protein